MGLKNKGYKMVTAKTDLDLKRQIARIDKSHWWVHTVMWVTLPKPHYVIVYGKL